MIFRNYQYMALIYGVSVHEGKNIIVFMNDKAYRFMTCNPAENAFVHIGWIFITNESLLINIISIYDWGQ